MQNKTTSIALPITSVFKTQTYIFTGVSVLAFSIPFLAGHPQWVVGTLVNACLFLGALYLPKKLYLPLIVFPSLGVAARGIMFGPLTPFLLYFVPFILLGNFVLIEAFKKSFAKFNYLTAIGISSVVKFLFLFLAAQIYFKFSLVPKIFLTSMGLFQLFTALAGGVISYLIFKTYGNRESLKGN